MTQPGQPQDTGHLRIFRGEDRAPEEAQPPLAPAGPTLPSSREIVAELKLGRRGAEIVASLVESETRAAITIPSKLTDPEALHALNAHSRQLSGRSLFADGTLFALELWVQGCRPPLSHQRTYPVELVVEATAGCDVYQSERVLRRAKTAPGMQLIPADPVEFALVYGAHVLRHGDDSPLRDRVFRTASPDITLTYLHLRGEIMLTHREPEDRHDAIFTAASPVPRQPQWGFLGFFKGSREAQ